MKNALSVMERRFSVEKHLLGQIVLSILISLLIGIIGNAGGMLKKSLLCSAYNIYIDGYDVPKDNLWRIGYDNLFPYKIIKNLLGYTWIPEDYITNSDSISDFEKEDVQNISESINEYRKKVFDLLEEKKEKFKRDMFKKD